MYIHFILLKVEPYESAPNSHTHTRLGVTSYVHFPSCSCVRTLFSSHLTDNVAHWKRLVDDDDGVRIYWVHTV
jgi:hypothetical protein